MVLAHTPIASLSNWSCSRETHDPEDRLLIHTTWNETLVAMPYCENQHEAGAFVLDPVFMPYGLQQMLIRERVRTAGIGDIPLVFLYNSTDTYGRGEFLLDLEAATDHWCLRVESAGTMSKIEAVSVKDCRRRTPSAFTYHFRGLTKYPQPVTRS
jgi:hypothetical protein